MTRFSECYKCQQLIFQEVITGIWRHDDEFKITFDHEPVLEWEVEKSDAEVRADQMNSANYDY